jgi:hypothetical protein
VPSAQHLRRHGVDVVVITLLRRILAPLVVAAIAALALLVPGAVGAQGTPVAAVFATGATGPTGPGGVAQPLSASVSACHSDQLQANRYAIFASQMNSVPGTRTMAVEFELQEREPGAPQFVTVSAPGFGVWVTSQPGVGIFTYSHEVTSLPAPAAFRVLVRARWLDRHRLVIHHNVLVSPLCAQPLETPDLVLGKGLTRHRVAGSPGTVTYGLEVLNEGTAAAGAFQVSLTVNGAALADASVTGLAAGATQVLQFSGPPCTAGSTLTAVADPGGAISEPADPARSRIFSCLP